MKKFVVLFAGLLLISTSVFSQIRFGVKGGLNFTKMASISSDVDETWKNQTGYQLGLALQMKVPMVGLAIQPELLYSSVKSQQDSNPVNSIQLDYLTLPVNVQLGVDMLVFRPFVVASPYISYAIQKGDKLSDKSWKDINRFDYGIGLGAGIDIWKIQVMGKYNWGLGKLQSAEANWDNADTYKKAKLQGFQLSVAYLF